MSDRPEPDNLRWVKIIGVTVVLTLIAIYFYYPNSPAGRQQRNMAAARQHLPRVLPLLTADSRFSLVTAEVYTGNEGALFLKGAVRSEDDLTELKAVVTATAPPTNVTWAVKVYPPEVYDELFDDNHGKRAATQITNEPRP